MYDPSWWLTGDSIAGQHLVVPDCSCATYLAHVRHYKNNKEQIIDLPTLHQLYQGGILGKHKRIVIANMPVAPMVIPDLLKQFKYGFPFERIWSCCKIVSNNWAVISSIHRVLFTYIVIPAAQMSSAYLGERVDLTGSPESSLSGMSTSSGAWNMGVPRLS